MKRVLPRTFGFFLITLLPLVGLHVIKLPIWGEVIDGVLSSFVFTLPYGMGLLLIKQFMIPLKSTKQEVYVGMISAACMWAVVWVFWSIVPNDFRSSAEVWAFNMHLALALITGMSTVVIRGGGLKKV
ncbi:MAG: hypothetical protein HRU41_09430 [Saprospiraceae bacterium]|nr:hypothetical protein [Saprospiraceae bacterium]